MDTNLLHTYRAHKFLDFVSPYVRADHTRIKQPDGTSHKMTPMLNHVPTSVLPLLSSSHYSHSQSKWSFRVCATQPDV